jgi:hypothetical protein
VVDEKGNPIENVSFKFQGFRYYGGSTAGKEMKLLRLKGYQTNKVILNYHILYPKQLPRLLFLWVTHLFTLIPKYKVRKMA